MGKLAADYLVSVFNAKPLAEFYSTTFPPHVNVDERGIAHRLKGEMFLAKTGQKRDILIFTADSQPATSDGEYELAEAVVERAKAFNASQVFSLAAYIVGTFVKERRVFGTATSKPLVSLLSKNGIEVMREGGISGMNGVVVGMAALHGLDGISLLGETSGYLLDPAASYSVLEALSRILELKVDLTSIEARAKEAQQLFGQVQRMNEPTADEPAGPGPEDEREPGYIA